MFEDIKKNIDEVNELIKKAVETDEAARKAYLDSTNERRDSLNEKIKELQAELDEEKAVNELRPQEMSEALSVSDADAAVKIEKEIKISNAKIAELEHKISLLSRAIPKGDSGLFHAAISVFRKRYNILKMADIELNKIDAKLKQIRQELKEKEEAKEDIRRKIGALVRTNVDNLVLIEIVESFEGAIDIAGHSAGTDEQAKLRYIKGNCRGIENTPAGNKLKTQIMEEF